MIAVLAVLAAAFYASSSGPVMASPAQMVAIHEDLVSGRIPVVEVGSIADANAALEREWARAPEVPHVPEQHVMACCTRDVQNKRMACVLLRSEGVPVTMAVARAADMRPPPGEQITRDGVTYLMHQQDNIAMVMHERDGRWVCLMGELPAEKLIDLAAGLRFDAN